MNKTFNDQEPKTSRQDSILEGEIYLLRSEISNISRLANIIFEMLGPISNDKCTSESSQIITVFQSLSEIRSDAEGAREKFEIIAKCLKEQLGNLKLES